MVFAFIFRNIVPQTFEIYQGLVPNVIADKRRDAPNAGFYPRVLTSAMLLGGIFQEKVKGVLIGNRPYWYFDLSQLIVVCICSLGKLEICFFCLNKLEKR
jgi:hypothetical protein